MAALSIKRRNYGDSAFAGRDENQDLRGRMLRAPNGRPLGKIRDMIANTESERVETVVLEDGAEYRVRDIQIRGDGEVIRSGRAEPPAGRVPGSAGAEAGETVRVPVIEEEVEVGKRPVADHGVRVTSEVKEEPVDETVTLRETKVNVDRRGANRPATEEDLRQAGRTVEAIETGEEPVVRKNARVIEEIILTREVNEREEKVHDTARKTEVHVEDVDPRNREGRKAS